MRKVFVLGLDGLEYDLVQKWNLAHLMQQEYGKIKVPINKELGYPITPEVWAAFLTGKHMKVEIVDTPPFAPLGLLFKLLNLLRTHTNLSLGLSFKIKNVTPKRLHGQRRMVFPPLKEPTFLDYTISKEINVPYYSYKHPKMIHDFASEKISLTRTIKLLKYLYMKRKRQILSATNENVDIVFAFMHFPDLIQHCLFTRIHKIQEHYSDLDYYVSILESKLYSSTIFIIVSDHGFDLKTGTHSRHGFYSSNINLQPKPRQITDFYNIITSH